VTTLVDADLQTMDMAVSQFASDLDDAGENTVGIFYYAGHGVSYQGENWLIPVGADIGDAAHLKYRTLSANLVLGLMEASRNATNVLILDACRNSPFRSFSLSGTRALSQGMGQMAIAPSGSFIAFSTAPGMVAFDGSGKYSPFAEALADEVSTSSESLGDMMIDVRVRVKEATEGLGSAPQITWDNSSLLGKFWFNPKGTADNRTEQIVVDNQREPEVEKTAKTQPEQTRPIEPMNRQTILACSSGPYDFPLESAGHNGQECKFSKRLDGLDNCTVTKVEVLVGGTRPQHITLSRSQSASDGEYWRRTPNASGENQWSTLNNGLNCSWPLGCGNGDYVALLAEGSPNNCDSFNDVRLKLSVR